MDGLFDTEHSDKFIVRYRQQHYDITEFLHKHPGGINTLKGLNAADMTSRFLKAPPHSDAAMYLLKEYKIHDEQYMGGKHKKLSNGQTRHRQLNMKHDSGIELLGTSEQQAECEDTNNNQLDESMEHMVDWSKAMLPQIANITKYYDEWVHKPVDRPLRLFGPWYLEMCTKTPWWVVPTFWIPVIIYCMWADFQASWSNISELAFLCGYFLFGTFFWTLIEYSLHRWVFHVKVSSESSPWLCTFHFMIHGLHHKVPFDPLRLVFPPVPGVIIASSIYLPISFILPHPRVFLAGALFGYLCYDIIHYYLHYGNPTNKNYMYNMKRYHYQHHFAHQDLGYGISSPLWDIIFKTCIKLRHLKYQLRWS